MTAVYLHENGETRRVDKVDPAWLERSSPTTLWVDLSAPTESDFTRLTEVFRFHPLSIDDARSALQFPKVEPYPEYLYIVLHGIDAEASSARRFMRPRILGSPAGSQRARLASSKVRYLRTLTTQSSSIPNFAFRSAAS